MPAIRKVLTDAIAAGGSTLRDYVQATGELGYFQHSFAVYDREGKACPGCTCDLASTGECQCFVGRVRDFGALRAPLAVTGEHDVAPAGKGSGKAIEGLAAHDHRLARGERLKALEVGRQAPG